MIALEEMPNCARIDQVRAKSGKDNLFNMVLVEGPIIATGSRVLESAANDASATAIPAFDGHATAAGTAVKKSA